MRADVRDRWDYVLVDEFQDLSLAQYEVVTELAARHRNCFAVGDDEQSIFSWTGADPAILGRFRDDFGIAEPIILDLNRRCSRQIFETARRLVTRNPGPVREAARGHPRVGPLRRRGHAFADETCEAEWVVADLLRDRAASALDWGEYGVLYRSHRIGQRLETRFIEAGIPCLMARGQALLDDELIGAIVASLRIIQAPDDPLPVEAFAEQVLPPALVSRIRATHRSLDLLTGLRVFARTMRGDPDARHAWRFVFHVENLAGLSRTHDVHPRSRRRAAVGAPRPVSQPAGRARGGAHAIRPRCRARRTWPTGCGRPGTRRHRLARAGPRPRARPAADAPGRRRRPGPPARRPATGPPPAISCFAPAARVRFLVFKALQLLQCRGLTDPLQDYVAFDLETTEMDAGVCDVVELAAVRVRGRVIVDQFQRLVRPSRPITPRATAVHGYRESDVCDQPPFADVWPAFRDFVGDDLLVAHNGHTFDVPVLRRAGVPAFRASRSWSSSTRCRSRARSWTRARGSRTSRTGSASRAAGRTTRSTTRPRSSAWRGTWASCAWCARGRPPWCSCSGWLGLALALDAPAEPTPEERVLRDVALPAALGRYSGCLEAYAEAGGRHGRAHPPRSWSSGWAASA